jgi:hypothetical protein
MQLAFDEIKATQSAALFLRMAGRKMQYLEALDVAPKGNPGSSGHLRDLGCAGTSEGRLRLWSAELMSTGRASSLAKSASPANR